MIRRLILTMITVVLLIPQTSFAILAKDRHAVNYETEMYDASDGSSACSSGSLPANTALDQPIIDGINANKAIYTQVAEAKNVPWQLLAAIHYRETGLGSYPVNTSLSDEEFTAETMDAADFLHGLVNSSTPPHRVELNKDQNDPEVIKDVMYSYNGRSGAYAAQAANYGFDPVTQPYEGSPYVMNKFDAARESMPIATRDKGGIDATDPRPGAFTIYAAIAGTGASCGASGSKIIDIAMAELGKNEADGSYLKYTGGNAEAWCADFVSWVLNQAGTPLSPVRIAGATAVRDWFKANGIWLDNNGTNVPQVGDVAYWEGFHNGAQMQHVSFVLSIDGADIKYIGGNQGNQVGIGPFWTGDVPLGWGRMK
jgi:hypothetical protein